MRAFLMRTEYMKNDKSWADYAWEEIEKPNSHKQKVVDLQRIKCKSCNRVFNLKPTKSIFGYSYKRPYCNKRYTKLTIFNILFGVFCFILLYLSIIQSY